MSDNYPINSKARFLALPLAEQWRIANRAGSPTLEEHIRRSFSAPDINLLRAKLNLPPNDFPLDPPTASGEDLEALKADVLRNR